eukprot:5774814-Pleurochrysis_carterae.AAC.1
MRLLKSKKTKRRLHDLPSESRDKTFFPIEVRQRAASPLFDGHHEWRQHPSSPHPTPSLPRRILLKHKYRGYVVRVLCDQRACNGPQQRWTSSQIRSSSERAASSSIASSSTATSPHSSTAARNKRAATTGDGRGIQFTSHTLLRAHPA